MKCRVCGIGLVPQRTPLGDLEGYRRHAGRRLCHPCTRACVRNGTLEDHPRITRTAAEVLADFESFRKRYNGDRKLIAERMGIKYDTLNTVLARHQRRIAGV